MTDIQEGRGMRMITVSYTSEILGSDVFWKGLADDIHEIRNEPARMTAEAVVEDGVTRKCGMWTVSAEDVPTDRAKG